MSDSTRDLLQGHLVALTAERDALVESVAPLRWRLDELNAEIEAKRAAAAAVVAEIDAATRPRIIQLSEEISTVARALGARSMTRDE